VASFRSELVDKIPPSIAKRLRSVVYSLRRDFVDEADIIRKIESKRPSPTNSVVVDVGAHHGVVTSLFLDKGWSAVAYEPDPVNRKAFERRIGKNPRVQLSTSAVSDKPAKSVSFFTSSVSTGISALAPFHGSHEPTATVDIVTLAEDLRERGVGQVEFLKIDIEGYDFFALKGFDWTRKPRFVLYEFEDRKTVPLGYSLRDSSNFLTELGYHVIYSVWEPIVEYGSRHRWRGFFTQPPADVDTCWGNVLGFRDLEDVPSQLRARLS
jgi:FkbM family methyltransferase